MAELRVKSSSRFQALPLDNHAAARCSPWSTALPGGDCQLVEDRE